jgi:hypothetical protein
MRGWRLVDSRSVASADHPFQCSGQLMLMDYELANLNCRRGMDGQAASTTVQAVPFQNSGKVVAPLPPLCSRRRRGRGGQAGDTVKGADGGLWSDLPVPGNAVPARGDRVDDGAVAGL